MIRAFVAGGNTDFAAIIVRMLSEYQMKIVVADTLADMAAGLIRDPRAVGLIFARNEIDAAVKVRAIRNTPCPGLVGVFMPPSPVSNGARRAAALKAGADDAQIWPVGAAEIVERVKAMIRRDRTAPPDRIEIGAFEWLADRRLLRGPAGRWIHLTGPQREIMAVLARHAGQPIQAHKLAEMAGIGGKRRGRIKVEICGIRKAAGGAAAGPLIETVHGVGYRLAVADA